MSGRTDDIWMDYAALRKAVDESLSTADWLNSFRPTTNLEREAIKLVVEPLRQAIAKATGDDQAAS